MAFSCLKCKGIFFFALCFYMDPIHSICICGAGTMGSGIAQVVAQSGFVAILYDLDKATLETAKKNVQKNLQSLVAKGKLTDEIKGSILSRMQFTSDINSCIADLIIEAIIERPDAKISLLNQ